MPEEQQINGNKLKSLLIENWKTIVVAIFMGVSGYATLQNTVKTTAQDTSELKKEVQELQTYRAVNEKSIEAITNDIREIKKMVFEIYRRR